MIKKMEIALIRFYQKYLSPILLLQVHADLLSICHRGDQKVWICKRNIAGGLEDFALQSFCQGRI